MATEDTRRDERRAKTKRWLNRYCFYSQLNNKMLDLIASAEDNMQRVTAQLEQASTHTAQDVLSGQLATLDKLCAGMQDFCGMYGEFLDEITEAIERVGEIDNVAGSVLAYRYLTMDRQLEFDEIAAKLGYSESHIKALHARALDYLAARLT